MEVYGSQFFWLLIVIGFIYFFIAKNMVPKISKTVDDRQKRITDDLAALGELVKTPEANVIKLPNVSASIPQMKAAIAELQRQQYAGPVIIESEAEAASDERTEGLKRQRLALLDEITDMVKKAREMAT